MIAQGSGILLLGLVSLLLGACTSTWRAPMENRSAGHTRVAPAASRTPRRMHNATHYRVRTGDTLFSIAWRSNRDFRQLARWNGIRPPYVIYAGQLIRLKPISSSRKEHSAAPPSRPRTAKTDTQHSHVVHRPPTAKTRSVSGSRRLDWKWPSVGRVVSRYKAGDPLRKGVKIAATEGSVVRAAESGKVVYSGSGLIGYGRLIIIKHNDKYLSAYGHNRKLLVKQNQQVTKGQKIAEMGTANDGRALLHFEIRRDGRPIDPLALLPRR